MKSVSVKSLPMKQRSRMHPGTEELCAMAARGLVAMLDPAKNLFCHRLKQTAGGLTREGLSPRYTAMTVLGLQRFADTGRQTSPLDLQTIFQALLADLAWVDNIGDLGLLLWVCAVMDPERLDDLYAKLGVTSALDRFCKKSPGVTPGVTMELAWFLTGLAHAALAGAHHLPDLQALAAKTFSILIVNQGAHGLFGHSSRSGSATAFLRGRIGSFADQVYPIYAFSKFGEAFHNSDALSRAAKCAEAICRAQGSQGQWWWHYDATTGRVFQRYPVYSVHQHGMAPLALFALGDATGSDFSAAIDKGLGWIQGNNELHCDLRETSAGIVWRSIYRQSRAKMYIREFTDFLKDAATPVRAGEMGIVMECRPYELGWLLFALAGRAAA